MLAWCSISEMTTSSPAARKAPKLQRHQVDRLGGVAGEDDLVLAGGAEEAGDGRTRASS
jgi:hypothetical protein